MLGKEVRGISSQLSSMQLFQLLGKTTDLQFNCILPDFPHSDSWVTGNKCVTMTEAWKWNDSDQTLTKHSQTKQKDTELHLNNINISKQ